MLEPKPRVRSGRLSTYIKDCASVFTFCLLTNPPSAFQPCQHVPHTSPARPCCVPCVMIYNRQPPHFSWFALIAITCNPTNPQCLSPLSDRNHPPGKVTSNEEVAVSPPREGGVTSDDIEEEPGCHLATRRWRGLAPPSPCTPTSSSSPLPATLRWTWRMNVVSSLFPQFLADPLTA